ncbi:right-handed parallel beta-helix repeat-containing protein [Nonomuraea sp. 3N208]|uniref:right-handed parallel beta-helix repeat-containing protein n=1 Tax=Nonomuraea sp. 3N208 TaxID=3457421 RepID=UPI003FCF8F15
MYTINIEAVLMNDFYVAVDGDDSAPGTAEHPFATVERAAQAARAAGGGTVHLRAGTHVLTRPLELTEADSGTTYQAHGYGTAHQEEVTLSGGREITGWREEGGRWLADVGDLDTRQLYVDGRRAERAALDALPGEVSVSETGYVTDSTEPLGWHSPADVEFVYRGLYPWTEARIGVTAVAGSPGVGAGVRISMAEPAFERAYALYNSTWEGQTSSGPGLPTRVENDASFLTEPGTFALDRSRRTLHYLPRAGEQPGRTRVVAPVLETLVHLRDARDVAFLGLGFADATWLRPSRTGGFLHYHGSGYYEGGPIERVTVVEGQAWVTVPGRSETVPACVVLDGAAEVRVEGCRFTRLGATGLGLSGGSGLSVRGCDFDTLSASAISVSDGQDVLVEDNWIHHVGLDHSGSPGIALTGTRRCTVVGNHVADVPHCGIVAGPGEGTRILRNLTTGTMQVLADGGGIYLSHPQGSSAETGAVIAGNVIEDTRTPYNFGLYTDYGAAWVTVEENVVTRADSTAVLTVHPPLENVVYRGNFWDADPLGSDDPPAGVTYEGNRTIADEQELRAATAGIRARAGLRRAVQA